jgi:putative endonuclease
MLVFYEIHGDMVNAVNREKQIKAGSRKKKLALIENMNPDWKDLYDEII